MLLACVRARSSRRARARAGGSFAHVAFSGGPRDCVGRRFAMLEAVGVLALLLRSFRFEAVEGYRLQTEVTGIVQKPKGNMPLKATLRA
jgi:cytochrome P450